MDVILRLFGLSGILVGFGEGVCSDCMLVMYCTLRKVVYGYEWAIHMLCDKPRRMGIGLTVGLEVFD